METEKLMERLRSVAANGLAESTRWMADMLLASLHARHDSVAMAFKAEAYMLMGDALVENVEFRRAMVRRIAPVHPLTAAILRAGIGCA
jgi:hypothetical protein